MTKPEVNIIQNDFPSKLHFTSYFLFLILVVSYFSRYFSDQIIVFPLLIVGVSVFIFALVNDKFWLITSILIQFPLFIIAEEKVTIFKTVSAFYLYIPLVYWFFKKIFIIKEKIIIDKIELLLLLFFLISLLSIFSALINGSDIGLWFREFLVIMCYLFYFPIRDFLKKDENGLKWIIGATIFASVLTAIFTIYKYKSKLALATQFFQVYGSRVSDVEQLFMFSILILFSLFVFLKSKEIKTLFLISLGISTIALFLSFTRSYIAVTVLGILAIPFMVGKSERKKMYKWIFIFLVLFLIGMLILFSDMLEIVFNALIYRFIGRSAKADSSIIQRVIETTTIIQMIIANPILGSGLASSFRRYDLWFELHRKVFYMHNAYLYIWFKLGLLGLITLISFYIGQLLNCWRIYKHSINHFIKHLSITILFILTSFLALCFTDSHFVVRPSVLIFTICWAIIAKYNYPKNN